MAITKIGNSQRTAKVAGWTGLLTFGIVVFVNDYWFDSPMAIFELVLSFWLLFKGIGTPNHGEADHVNARSTKSVSLQLPKFI